MFIDFTNLWSKISAVIAVQNGLFIYLYMNELRGTRKGSKTWPFEWKW